MSILDKSDLNLLIGLVDLARRDAEENADQYFPGPDRGFFRSQAKEYKALKAKLEKMLRTDKSIIQERIQYYIDTGSARGLVVRDLIKEGISEQIANYVLNQLIREGTVRSEDDGYLKWNYRA